MKEQWKALDNVIRGWWDGDMRTAHEEDICDNRPDWTWVETIKTISGRIPAMPPGGRTLLYLPFPFSPAGGSQGAFPEMFGWDTFYINLGMMAHQRYDLVQGQILNHLFMIMRYGKVLNANRTYFLTRSQSPLHPESVWRFYQQQKDRKLLFLAYGLLEHEYLSYWMADHHSTPIGLATNRDLGDPYLRPELAAVAETGLDFTPCFGDDIRQCVPIATNCQLVNYAWVLSRIAHELGQTDEALRWQQEAENRSELIRHFCWNEDQGFFFEYNYVTQQQIPVWSLCAYWTMWAGVATAMQEHRLVENLIRFEQENGLTFTDRFYASPYPEFPTLQWSYPYCWHPLMITITETLHKCGYRDDARRVGLRYLRWVLRQYEETGRLWEKIVAVPNVVETQVERYENSPFHGWASAAVVVIGRLIGLADS